MEQIIAGVINQAWGLVSGSLVTVFVGGIGVWLWVKVGLQKLAKEQPAILVNKIALLIHKYFLKNIKDKNLRDQITKDLDCSGDEFNYYWDEGLKGIDK